MNKRSHEEMHQEVIVDAYPPGRQSRFTHQHIVSLVSLLKPVVIYGLALLSIGGVVFFVVDRQGFLAFMPQVFIWFMRAAGAGIAIGLLYGASRFGLGSLIAHVARPLVHDVIVPLRLSKAEAQAKTDVPFGNENIAFYRAKELTPYQHVDTRYNVRMEGQPQIGAPDQFKLSRLSIPTFAESLRAGEIGPGQNDVLICHEIIRDDDGNLTGETIAYRDAMENNCTMFLGGSSKSGKSTLIVGLSGQEAIMRARFLLIDPHLMNHDKSIARRLEPLSSAFILPPAMTDADVYTVLQCAREEALAREQGRETALSGVPIVFIVDEVLNLFGRAQRTDNREIQQLYRELALFMRDLGSQYNKFGMNGIFASQYITKDAFKLPGGNFDFRDACQSQGLLRLPPNQAQAMRMLPPAELAGMRKLPPGHGYMAFAGGDIIRMAFGNVTRADMEEVARMIDPPKLSRQFSLGARVVSPEPRWCPPVEPAPPIFGSTMQGQESMPVQTERQTGALPNRMVPPVEPAPPGAREHPEDTESTARVKKRFTSAQELEFIRLYSDTPNIRKCLSVMHLGQGDYQAYASQVVERRKLRKI